ncbi:MAG: MBOAT family protein [Planctomycetes bacterium]|nr:MBOAT family protein [Planctomycetota bacterium]
MVFSSHIFLFYFLPAGLLLYYLCPRRLKQAVLTILSYIFYGWANPLFALLMLATTLIDYIAGLAMTGQFRLSAWRRAVPPLPPGGARSAGQKAALICSVAANLAILGFFKYFNFAAENYNWFVTAAGISGLRLDSVMRVVLPLGISFYTFQSMSYAIDVYRGRAAAARNFADYACFVSMFPQLVAGPIIRFTEVAGQLKNRSHTFEKFARGTAFFAMGLAKKILLANPCGQVADAVFDAGSRGVAEAWAGAVAYSMQIYFDFSGYSDMAIGLGLMLGFVFPKNFDSPYLSRSITEFWRRWHISLSTWLKDYLYIPLGGNRKGAGRTYANIAIVMLLGGLWHGAAWTFLIWGAMHGALLMLERTGGKKGFWSRLPAPAATACTFVFVSLTWVFFRSPDLISAMQYLGNMFGLGGEQQGSALLGGIILRPYYLASLGAACCVTWLAPQTWDFTRTLTAPKAALAGLLVLISEAILSIQGYNPFIYFIF